MKTILHNIYLIIGHIFCRCCLVYWNIRDFLFPPKEHTVLFVAHPDDDTLFFHTFIKEQKPYVCLCTTGWSLRRLPCFFKAMRHYGVRFRAYDLHTRDTRIKRLEEIVCDVFSLGHFALCATHNADGEYGHEMHVRVHNAVIKKTKIPVICPTPKEVIEKHPLPLDIIKEKEYIFKNIYVTETWVLDENTIWVNNEYLEPNI